jgi:hypothetical protein
VAESPFSSYKGDFDWTTLFVARAIELSVLGQGRISVEDELKDLDAFAQWVHYQACSSCEERAYEPTRWRITTADTTQKKIWPAVEHPPVPWFFSATLHCCARIRTLTSGWGTWPVCLPYEEARVKPLQGIPPKVITALDPQNKTGCFESLIQI